MGQITTSLEAEIKWNIFIKIAVSLHFLQFIINRSLHIDFHINNTVCIFKLKMCFVSVWS